jgi:hypothetical protein
VDDALRFREPRLSGAPLAPRLFFSSLSVRLGGPLGEREIRSATEISRGQWRDLGRAFPRLGPDPGPEAARQRRLLRHRIGLALESDRHAPAFRPAPLPEEPCLYATAHVGDIRSLRYLLRPRLAIAAVSRERRSRPGAAEHPEIEDRVRRDFPHVLSANEPHRLRSALRRGSLIMAADMPEEIGLEARCLGGTVRIDPRPFRLARIAGVPCRPLFLTCPDGRLTITAGPVLAPDEEPAAAGFADALDRITEESPLDIDGFTWWNRLGKIA